MWGSAADVPLAGAPARLVRPDEPDLQPLPGPLAVGRLPSRLIDRCCAQDESAGAQPADSGLAAHACRAVAATGVQ